MTDILDYASDAYYSGNPIMTDEEFDAISENYAQIGHKISGIPHKFPMWSLDKVYDDSNKLTGTVETPKLDGAAVALYYENGKFYQALTRGNGKEGLDITDKVQHLVPQTINITGTIQITGEIVAPKHIKNARNYAAGALNLKDVNEFLSRELYFVAYGVLPEITDRWSKDMEHLKVQGFSTVWTDLSLDDFPTDGTVVRVDNYEAFRALGYTSKFPKGAFARKTRAEGSITTLLDVEWNVGRSGVVAPIAILKPVLVGDATVSRATLHNYDYIKSLNLEIGCKVEVIRSGEIIPRIIRRVDAS